MNYRTKCTLGFFAALSLAACAGDTKKDAALTEAPPEERVSAKAAAKDSVSIEAKLAAAEQNTTDVTEVEFQKGSRSLPKEFRDKIRAALVAAEKKAPLQHITIVAWSDAEMPIRQEPDLDKQAQKLATDRGEVVRAYVHQIHPKLSADIVNMAQRPGKVKKLLRTDDVRIQQAIEVAGHGDPKASRAVVIIQTKTG